MRSLNIKRFGIVIATSALMSLSFGFTACNNDDDAKVEYDFLEAFGPLPVARGGELTFIGHNLSNVVSVTFPNGTTVDVNRISSDKFTITVPDDDAVAPGQLTLNFSNGGTYITKTECRFSEPITIKSLSSEVVKPGTNLEINGRYLLQATEVAFAGDVKVSLEKTEDGEFASANVVSVSDSKIVVKVPAEAVSGKVVVTDGSNPVETEKEVTIVTPAFSKYTVNENLLRGKSELEIQGTDMDLVSEIKFSNGLVVAADDATVTESSIKFVLPINTPASAPVLVTASGQEFEAADLNLINPTATAWEGNPSEDGKPIKWDGPMTIKGTNLDMVEKVELFTADVNSEVSTMTTTASQLDFTVPSTCKTTEIWSNEAGKNINVGKITLVLFSGEKVEVTTDDKQLVIGWPWGGVLAKEDFTAGEEVTVQSGSKGVASIEVAGKVVDFKEDKDAGNFKFTWPIEISGSEKTVKVTYVNGMSTEIKATPKVPELPFVMSISEKTDNGGTIVATGGNFDKVTMIMAGDAELTEFTASADGKKLYITVPLDFKACQAPLDLIVYGDKKGVSPTITIGNPEVVVWEGDYTDSGWKGIEYLSWDKNPAAIEKFKGIKVGDKFRVYATNNGSWIQCGFRLADGWKDKFSDGSDCQMQKDDLSAGYFEWTVTQQMYDEWKIGSNGIIIYFNGDGYTVTKFTFLSM